MKTKAILIVLVILFFSCKKEIYYTYEYFDITNGTMRNFTVSFDSKDYLVEAGVNLIVEIEHYPISESRNITQADFKQWTEKLSICRTIDGIKTCVPKEKYETMEKWSLLVHSVSNPDEQFIKHNYAITLSEDVFASKQ